MIHYFNPCLGRVERSTRTHTQVHRLERSARTHGGLSKLHGIVFIMMHSILRYTLPHFTRLLFNNISQVVFVIVYKLCQLFLYNRFIYVSI